MNDETLEASSYNAAVQKSLDTGWAKEPTLQELKEDFQSAKPYHDTHVENIRRWNELRDVKGKSKPKAAKGRSSVQPKLIRRQAEWRYPALTEPFLSSEKLFAVSPVTFEDHEAANQNELVLNWQFRTKLNRIKFIDDYIRSGVDDGTVVVQTGWKRHTVMVDEEVPVWEHYPVQTEEQTMALQQAIELQEADPRGYNENVSPDLKAAVDYYIESQEATFAFQIDTETIQVERIIENRPTVQVKDMDNVYIDPSCNGDISKALFIISSFETNKAELLKEGDRYSNLDSIRFDTAGPVSSYDHSTKTPDDFQFHDTMRRKIVAYEYWGFYDIHDDGNLVPFVATWVGDVLIRMELNPFPDEKLPFVLVQYSPVKRELYGEPDAELLEDNQKILGATTRGIIDLLGRSANAQQGFAKGMLDPLNRRRYDNGEDYEFNPNANPAQNIIEHKFPEIPNSALSMMQIQNGEAEALTGIKAFSGGLTSEAYGDVATGIQGMLDAAGKREMAILRRLAQGMTEIGNKIIAMNAVFLSEEEVVRVTNEEYVTVQREDLKGNFDLEVDISTAEVDNTKAQDLAFMLQTIGPNTEPQIVMMILSEIADLKRMPKLANRLRNWSPQPSPEQQEMARLEIEEKQLEVQKLQSEVELNQARARKELSEADRKDLDYVEQETGTKHARDLEKQKAQARGNQELEVTKALTKSRKEGETPPNIEGAVGYNQLSQELTSTQ